ncbi:MAG: 2-amino-4-hydroxy-6-hydroxymethyldihydropteridine diphosphokinase [Acidobacteria bacterium]|nr:2-amino-4-hydroxy-6-hydroxymethyldihydropteridine diphosphokinase [Acidobacteriota bacterium]
MLALGSNRGDREVHLRRALSELSRYISVVTLSSTWETEPVDSPVDAAPFLNIVIAGWTRLEPLALLEAIGTIERKGGRRRLRRNDPRTIDIDILFVGGRAIRLPGLVVPHPRFHERNFVLEPLREIARTFPIPPFAGELRSMDGKGAVRRAGRLY